MQTESQDTCSTKEKMPYRANLRISGYTELEIPESFDINIKGNIVCLTPKTLEKLIDPKFKDGDILTNKFGKPFILKAYLPEIDNVWSYCGIDCANKFNKSSNNWTFAKSVRFATEEEKEILLQAIKDNGYKWNAETKTLEKLKKEKFDISTLKPFKSRVLVRNVGAWKPAFFWILFKRMRTSICGG